MKKGSPSIGILDKYAIEGLKNCGVKERWPLRSTINNFNKNNEKTNNITKYKRRQGSFPIQLAPRAQYTT
jgi:hypothetical protein